MLAELKALLKSLKLWITIIGVSLIPALYNLIFLSSIWDPYGNVKDLPVAVVNKDKSARFQDKALNIGHDMVDNMSKNKNLDYHFVTETEAQKGIEDGDYYMVITFPENLSSNAASLLTNDPKKLEISYQTTAGHSFVSSKMSDSAMSKLKETVSKNITSTYVGAVFKSMSQLQGGMGTAANGASQLYAGAGALQSGGQILSNGLGTLAGSTQTLATGVDTLSSGASAYTSGVSTLSGALSQLNSNSEAVNSAAGQFASGAEAMNTLVTGANSLSTALSQMATATSLSEEQQTQLSSLSANLTDLNTAIQNLNTAVSNTSFPSGTSTTSVDTSSIATYLSNISSTASSIATASATDKANDLAAVQGTAAYQSLTADQQAEIASAISNAGSTASSYASTIASDVSSMSTALSSLAGTTTTSSGESSNLVSLQTSISGIASSANTLLPVASSTISSMQANIANVNSVLVNQLSPGAIQVASGVSRAQSTLATGASNLLTGLSTYTGAVSTKSGTSVLNTGVQQLAIGGNNLTNGLTNLSTNLFTLSDSLNKANQQLSLISVNSENAKIVSAPLKVKKTDKDKVDTNGVGMAPYMISVSLMVVALSTNVIFAKSLTGRSFTSRFDWSKNKLFINGIIATMAAIALYIAIRFMGVEPNHPLATFGMILLAAWTLMALVTALVGWDDRYGAFASMILLLLQLGSSAGTYPIELSPNFFKVVQPFLPMSYSVSGLRQTISMTGQISDQVRMLVIFLLTFVVVGIVIYRPKTENV
ncbi:YhgE/Pip domain-containing protein [Streptococcus thermophilus]|nr:YhgE/Pip domain-containing protein [Streptococcus thermophilus]